MGNRDKICLFWRKVYRVCYWHLLEKPMGALAYRLPIRENRAVFDNFGGRGFGDNPKYIAQVLHRLAPEMEIIWLEDNLKEYTYPEYITPVKVDSLRALRMRGTAKVWVDNVRHLHPVKKKMGQVYLQTWHGPFALKRVEKDAEDKLGQDYIRQAMYDGAITDGILADSKLQELQFRRAFWLGPETRILPYGLPRNDDLVNRAADEAGLKHLREKLGLDGTCCYILYAPTFRDDHSTEGYALDFEGIAAAFAAVMGKPCRILVRLHPAAAYQKKEIRFTDRVLDGSEYPDMQDLALCCDGVISDYSSSIFDFAMLHKPAFICALDLEQYEKTRGLLEEFYTLPFPVARTNAALIEAIRQYREEDYADRVDAFFRKYPFYDRGDAAERAAGWILENIR